MDDKKLNEDLSKIKNELLEMVTAIKNTLQEKSTIKTDWLDKKMR